MRFTGPAPPPWLEERVELVPLPGERVPVRVLRVAPRRGGPHPGWVVLHGLTVRGLTHPSLLRFTRALAASGADVMGPEIEPWTRLELAPDRARRILASGVEALAMDPRVRPGGVGVAGFSFGGPQALATAADPALAPHLRSVLAWGSYARFPSALAFAFSGEHAHGGEAERLRPDPYARWIAGSNLLPLAGALGSPVATATALQELARRWGEETIDAYGESAERLRGELRSGLPRRERELFDLFAPAPGSTPDPDGVAEVVRALETTAAAHLPLLDPLPSLGRIHVPVHLLHGRRDVLIPWSETRRLEALLRPRTAELHATITDLFAHSDDGGAPARRGRVRGLREGVALFRATRRLLAR